MAVPGYIPIYYLPGLVQGDTGVAVCDYPIAGDVQQGVFYADGLMMGTFAYPEEDEVRSGIGYGADGAEFVGSFTIGPFDPPVGDWPGQAASYEQILDAIQIQIMKYTGLEESKVREWYSDERPTFGDDPIITYRPTFESPFLNAGAGRMGTKLDFGIRVTIWLRYQSDSAGTHRLWGRQILGFRRLIISALHDHYVFDSYDTHGDPSLEATPLMYKVFQYVQSDTFDKKAVLADGKAVMDFVGGAVLIVHVPNLVS